MSFTTPPNLNQPDTSVDIIRPRKLGTVNCINVARLGEPITLRYFGASSVGAATGQAHATQEAAEADVLAWADGKWVPYEQQAVVPLSCQAICAKKFAPPADALLSELEALEQQATPGPWVHEDAFFVACPRKYYIVDTWERQTPKPEMKGNAALIAAMRNAPPILLARLRTAEAQVAQLTEQLTPGSPSERAPTQWAYEQACAALDKHRQRADAAEARVPRWVPVAEWEKVNHVEVRVLWILHKGWNLSEVYWDAIGQFWRRESNGDRFPHEVLYVIAAPDLPVLPPLPQVV